MKRRNIIPALAALMFIAISSTAQAKTVFYHEIPEDCNFLFVGDSRTVGMMQTIDNDKVGYICEVGKGYKWLKDTADEYIQDNTKKDMTIVFNLGVNDIYNEDKYVDLYNEYVFELEEKGCNVYFETVNPVGSKSKNVTNEQIDEFNKKMKEELNCPVIDTNSQLVKNGYETVDGLHYTKDTTKEIYKIVRKEVRKDQKGKNEANNTHGVDVHKTSQRKTSSVDR